MTVLMSYGAEKDETIETLLFFFLVWTEYDRTSKRTGRRKGRVAFVNILNNDFFVYRQVNKALQRKGRKHPLSENIKVAGRKKKPEECMPHGLYKQEASRCHHFDCKLKKYSSSRCARLLFCFLAIMTKEQCCESFTHVTFSAFSFHSKDYDTIMMLKTSVN